ncbi:MAG: hypothetical protein ACXWZ5_20660 [Mycobacterium sp.]
MNRHSRPSLHRAPLVIFAIALAAVTGLAVPRAATAVQPPITFDLTMYDPCIIGKAPIGTINVVWRDSGGGLNAQGSTEAVGIGRWEFCPDGQSGAVMPGDRIKVSQGSYTRNYVVPNLTIRVDRINALYDGTGPAGRTIGLWCPNGDWVDRYSVRVGQDGQWTFEPPVGDLCGSFDDYYAWAQWRSPNNDQLAVTGWEPRLGVTLGTANFSGQADAFADIEVSLDGVRDANGTATADGDGQFAGKLRDSSGRLVAVSPGDHVSAPAVAPNADWIVPEIEGTADKATEIVAGRCHDTGTAAGYVRVWVIRPGGGVRGMDNWGTEADGSFQADFTDFGFFGSFSANIKAGDRIKIDCFQTTDDWARLTFVVR